MESTENRVLIQKRIHDQIKKNRMAIFYRLRHLIEMEEKNEFINEVLKDYKKYYDFIVHQKENEKHNIEKLLIYLDNLIIEGELSENMLKRAKFQQENIINELGKVKKDLDEIISIVN